MLVVAPQEGRQRWHRLLQQKTKGGRDVSELGRSARPCHQFGYGKLFSSIGSFTKKLGRSRVQFGRVQVRAREKNLSK